MVCNGFVSANPQTLDVDPNDPRRCRRCSSGCAIVSNNLLSQRRLSIGTMLELPYLTLDKASDNCVAQ